MSDVKRYDMGPNGDNWVRGTEHDAEIRSLTVERDQAQCDWRSVLDNHVEALDEVRRERDGAYVRLAVTTKQNDDLRKRLAEVEALLRDSRNKFAELYVTLATEDLSMHDLRELRTLADQGGLAIDSAMQEASRG